MRVLVTGADGFVGKHLGRHLRAGGDEVLEVRGPDPGAPPAAGGAGAQGLEALDVLDAAAVARVVRAGAPEGIIHLAGWSSVAQSHVDPGKAFAVNALGTVHLLEAVRKHAPNARVLLVSSGEVYGNAAGEGPASERTEVAPVSPYAVSKLAAELAGSQYFRSYGVEVLCARPFNHLGAGQAAHFVVPSFARQLQAIRRGEAHARLEVGNLEPVRDFSHVTDVVEAYRLLLRSGIAGEVYNIASGAGRTIRSIVDELGALLGLAVEPTVVPERFRPAEIQSLVGDPSKLRALGWAPRHTVTEALRDVLLEVAAVA
ncbi:GDP-mannose 4,6-dehydratase [Pendulispora albinea]|uniref:GDP-mannose 4,6-dehydratase n=1 Tax=Pendulispora albinea TaxID=2741071 RepID=A0ABZ2LL94_9BACT